MWRRDDGPLTTDEAIQKLTLDSLRPLGAFFSANPPTRKSELVPLIVKGMEKSAKVRELYESLDKLGQAAVREATHDMRGELHRDQFAAKYGQMPAFSESDEESKSTRYGYRQKSKPTELQLFFPQFYFLPTDLRELLLEFVPKPESFQMPSREELPATYPLTIHNWVNNRRVEETEETPFRMRETAREALHDVKAVLRLVEAGKVRVTDKKRHPTEAAMSALTEVLQGGDFYTAEDESDEDYLPSGDLAIKAFAWPMLLQAGGLAEKSGGALKLTAAGVKALSKPPEETIRALWKKWRSSTLLDEFSRVEPIKGQGKAQLSALGQRRKAVVDGLSQCPVGRWVAAADFFRFLRATRRDFVVAHREYELYLCEHHYGNFGDGDRHAWEQLQGRYLLAFLFEYAATLGLLDVAYLPPDGIRQDFHDRWGADDYACLSRYDGLLYWRLNGLGAWCLELAEQYEPPARPVGAAIRVLPNLDVVALQPPLDAGDRLLLERFAEPQSDAVWRLTRAKVLTALEEGGSLKELSEFLTLRGADKLPQTVQVFLDDLRQRADLFRDLGSARLLECTDPMAAHTVVNDSQVRGKCKLAGERWIVFRAEDESAVRRALRRLGYVVPRES